jgi:hypothetical protein
MNAQNAMEGTSSPFVRQGTNILDGKAIAETVRAEVKKEAEALEREYVHDLSSYHGACMPPYILIIQIGLKIEKKKP